MKSDADGKQVWDARVPPPTSVACLPDGNVLVAGHTGRRAVELNEKGKEVWRFEAKAEVMLVGR